MVLDEDVDVGKKHSMTRLAASTPTTPLSEHKIGHGLAKKLLGTCQY